MPLVDGVELSRQVRIEQDARGEGLPQTGLHLRYERFWLPNVAPGAVGEQRKTWAYPVDILSGMVFNIVDSSTGKEALDVEDECVVWADMGIVGVVVPDGDGLSSLSSGDGTVSIPVSPTVTQYLDQGDYVVFPGVHNDPLEVIAVDKERCRLILAESPGSLPPGTYVSGRRYFVGTPTEWMRTGGRIPDYEWGSDVLDSSRIPAGKSVVFEFRNTGSAAKTLTGQVALYY